MGGIDVAETFLVMSIHVNVCMHKNDDLPRVCKWYGREHICCILHSNCSGSLKFVYPLLTKDLKEHLMHV